MSHPVARSGCALVQAQCATKPPSRARGRAISRGTSPTARRPAPFSCGFSSRVLFRCRVGAVLLKLFTVLLKKHPLCTIVRCRWAASKSLPWLVHESSYIRLHREALGKLSSRDGVRRHELATTQASGQQSVLIHSLQSCCRLFAAL